MPCLIIIILLGMPRLALFFIWLFTPWIGQAYQTILWPFLGFLFLPYTTLAYLWAANATHHQIDGVWVFVIIVGVLLDGGFHGGGLRFRRW